MKQEHLDIINKQFSDAISSNLNEKDKFKLFKNTVDAVKLYQNLIKNPDSQLLETVDVEEEDRAIIEYYTNIAGLTHK